MPPHVPAAQVEPSQPEMVNLCTPPGGPAPAARLATPRPYSKPTSTVSSPADFSTPVSAIPIESLTAFPNLPRFPHPTTPARRPQPAYSDFSVKTAPPDGLCIIHSFISSAQHQIGGDAFSLTVESVRDKVWNHCLTNYDLYVNAVTDSNIFKTYMNIYLKPTNCQITSCLLLT